MFNVAAATALSRCLVIAAMAHVLRQVRAVRGLLQPAGSELSELSAVERAAGSCNLLRPLIKIQFLLVPSGYIIIKIKKKS